MTFASQIMGYMLGLLAYGSYASATDNGVMSSKQAAEQSVQYMLEHLEAESHSRNWQRMPAYPCRIIPKYSNK